MNIFNKDEEKENMNASSAEHFDPESGPANNDVANAPEMPTVGQTEIPQPTAQPAAGVEDLENSENEETLIVTLEKLREEINALKLEKAHVIESEEKLRVKIESEIETKRRNIEGLKAEIPVLKQRCEKLANILQIPVCK